MTSKNLRKMWALAGICVMAATANAIPVDSRITIDRALNSPTLTVRYEGANAALVELRLNGESLGTRSVVSSKSSGETNFTLNLTELKDGDNDIEVRLYDRTGKLVGSDKSSISTDQTNYGPVFLKTPKVGATVRGNVEINLGFGRDLKNVFVSFFVDNNFKKMTNYPPFTLNWDTTGETNGWHEVEAWAIDEAGTTYKTRKTRVFLDNPSGRTDRQGSETDITPSKNPSHDTFSGNPSGLKSLSIKSTGKATEATRTEMAPKVTTTAMPTYTEVTGSASGLKRLNIKSASRTSDAATKVIAPTEIGATVGNSIEAKPAGDLSGLKPAPTGATMAAGARSMTPRFDRVAAASALAPKGSVSTVSAAKATPAKSVAAHATGPVAMRSSDKGSIDISVHQAGAAVTHVAEVTNLVRIVRGQRLPNLTTFEVVLNSSIVDFPDVQPRVDDGVPMTPLRYLLEKDGGVVDWENLTKTVTAKAEGRDIVLQMGDKNAKVNKLDVSMEVAPYIDRGRTVVPLSFIHDALKVNVEYDKETGHVLISSDK